MTIAYGFHPSPFGECFIAVSNQRICGLSFGTRAERTSIINTFAKDWANAKLCKDQKTTGGFIERIFSASRLKPNKKPVRLLCRGTTFQIRVWEALLKVPKGSVVTYKTIAKEIGSPWAVRAVGTAVGKNPVGYLIPCHRVIRSNGHLGGYRWGVSRKRAMLGMEADG